MTLLLDGGMGQELRARGLNPDANVAGHALLDSPIEVKKIHEDFIAAGADIITAWNYPVTPHRVAASGNGSELGELTRIAVKLANEARADRSGVRIAGSLPPLQASYIPNQQNSVDMAAEYAEIAGHLASGVDLFICETMSSISEAAAAASAAAIHGKPVWVSWTLRDENDGLLRSGETVDAALDALKHIPVEAVLFNCCSVGAISSAMPYLRTATDHLIGGYANAFVPIDKSWKRQGARLRDLRDLTPDEYAQVVTKWRQAGADIVGGCCGIGPTHIARLHEIL